MTAPAQTPPDVPGTGNAYAWYVVVVLILAYTMSYVDRTILTLMVDPIRKSLKITDVQISLLQGLAFATFYTALGIPIGRLVDRWRRVGIVTSGVMTWSVMTGLCGLSRSFGQMFLARIGVGIGEATLSPAAYSLIADYFPPASMTRALSVYTCAMYLGAGLAMIAGGSLIGAVVPTTLPLLGALDRWQLVFLWVALPGFAVALLTGTLREPPRRKLVREGAADIMPSPADIVRHLRGHGAAYTWLILGYAFSGLAWNGLAAWIPSYLMRGFGWTPAHVGLTFGTILLVCGTAGIVSGGALAGRMRAAHRTDANLRVGIVSAMAALPTGLTALLCHAPVPMVGALALFVLAAAMPYGAAAAAIQEITPSRMRGQVSALYLLVLNLAGIGLGPTLVALIGARLSTPGPTTLGSAMAILTAVALPASALCLWRGCRPYRTAIAT